MVLWDWNFQSPFREIERMRRRMDRLFGDVSGSVMGAPFPAVNLWADDDKAVATCELPGVKTEDIDISVENDVLTLRGSREPEEVEEEASYRRHERGYGRFSRTIPLPFPVDADAVEAGYDAGILRITLPRSERSKPRQIEIK
jgi:HSP20 family protein